MTHTFYLNHLFDADYSLFFRCKESDVEITKTGYVLTNPLRIDYKMNCKVYIDFDKVLYRTIE
jgi:hypothetical protein